MKRVCVSLILVAVFVVLCAGAFADEILFRNIPWGSHPKAFEDSIKSKSIYHNTDTLLPRWEGIKTDQYIDAGNAMLGYWNANPTGHEIAFYGLAGSGFTVSGYSVGVVEAYFRYGVDENGRILKEIEDSEMYLAKYEFEASDKEAAYYDLKDKLGNLYGQGEEFIDHYEMMLYSMDGTSRPEISDITRFFIQGDNNTWVLLEKLVKDEECTTLLLIYADGEADRKLDELVAAQAKQEQINGENNYDGL